jgi:hypothetical protein
MTRTGGTIVHALLKLFYSLLLLASAFPISTACFGVQYVYEERVPFVLMLCYAMLCYTASPAVLLLYTMQTQASLFSDYFGACPVVTVPGRTFPVQTHFIDHINKALGQGGRSGNSGSTVSTVYCDTVHYLHF